MTLDPHEIKLLEEALADPKKGVALLLERAKKYEQQIQEEIKRERKLISYFPLTQIEMPPLRRRVSV